MNTIVRPPAINQEVDWDKSETIISKTDKFGTIEYCNEVFCNVSGYEDYELMHSPHNIIRHPDMPKVVFKWLWDNLNNDTTLVAIVKNLAKSGRYYWVYANFTILKDEKGDNHYFSSRKAVSKKVIEIIEPIYKKLLEIEAEGGMEASETFLINFLKENKTTYNEFIDKILKENNN